MNRNTFTSGGIGSGVGQFEAYGCFKQHPCLGFLGIYDPNAAMCYVYDEYEHMWHPWAPQSEMQKCVKSRR
jgi:hypothetical protein